jgi:hypothetical protein
VAVLVVVVQVQLVQTGREPVAVVETVRLVQVVQVETDLYLSNINTETY